MDAVALRVGYGSLLLGAVIVSGACRDGLSAVERAEATNQEPVVILAGEIVIESSPPVTDTARVVLNFAEPPSWSPIESHTLGWSGTYRLLIFHDDVCSWSLHVVLWDGRRSESIPVTDDPNEPCEGFMIGPTFWFP